MSVRDGCGEECLKAHLSKFIRQQHTLLADRRSREAVNRRRCALRPRSLALSCPSRCEWAMPGGLQAAGRAVLI